MGEIRCALQAYIASIISHPVTIVVPSTVLLSLEGLQWDALDNFRCILFTHR